MAGKELSDYLGTGDYDRFYQLFHGMGDAMIARCSLTHTSFYILQNLLAHEPETFPDKEVLADIQQAVSLTEGMSLVLRKFYWPYQSDDRRTDIPRSMERWLPYDSSAWDAMFAEHAAILHSLVQSVRAHFEKINAYSLGSSHNTEKVQEILQSLRWYLDVLGRWCNTEEVEYMLFHSHEYIRGESPFGRAY